jgi:hypothetical protein
MNVRTAHFGQDWKTMAEFQTLRVIPPGKSDTQIDSYGSQSGMSILCSTFPY